MFKNSIKLSKVGKNSKNKLKDAKTVIYLEQLELSIVFYVKGYIYIYIVLIIFYKYISIYSCVPKWSCHSILVNKCIGPGNDLVYTIFLNFCLLWAFLKYK